MNIQEKILTALVHTARYLRQCADRLKNFDANVDRVEDQLCDIDMSVSDMAISLDSIASSQSYDTPEYWCRLRVEIVKELLPCLLTKYDEDVIGKIAIRIASNVVSELKANPYFTEKLQADTYQPPPYTIFTDNYFR